MLCWYSLPLRPPLSSCFVCSWSYSPCLRYHCWHPTVVYVIYSLFVLPFVVPPAPSPQYIGAAYFAGCIIQPKIRVHYAHTHPVQNVWIWLLVACCTRLAHLFKFFQPFFPFVMHFFTWGAIFSHLLLIAPLLHLACQLSIAMPPFIIGKCFDCSAPIPQSAGFSVFLCATAYALVCHHCQLLHSHGMRLLMLSLILLLYSHSSFYPCIPC